MGESRTQAAVSYKPLRSPRGAELSCKGWQQEAALRMLMNSVDPAVAERPKDLIVCGGVGKVARDWQAFQAIVNSLRALEDDETLVIHSGEPGPIRKTQSEAPRLVISNSAPSERRQESDSAGIGRGTPTPASRIASDWMFTGPASAVPEATQVFRAAARKHFGGSFAGRLIVAGGMGGMGGAQALAATLLGAAFLGIDADAERIKRRLKAGYSEVMVNNLDEALRILKNAVRKRAPASVGLIANTSELVPELATRGILPDLLTDQTPADDPSSYLPAGLTMAQAAELRERDSRAYREKALDSIAAQVRGMLELKKMGAVAFEFGNGMRAQALARGVTDAYQISDFVSEYLLPDFAQGRGLLTVVALSGDTGDLARIDDLFPALIPGSEFQEWVPIARRRPSPGLPARSFWIAAPEAIKLGAAINHLVARGDISAPVVMGRAIGPKPNPGRREDERQTPSFDAIIKGASGAAWIATPATDATNDSRPDGPRFAIVLDGRPQTAKPMERLFSNEFAF